MAGVIGDNGKHEHPAAENTRFERLIAEAVAASQAGVFMRTPVDVAALAAAPAARGSALYQRILVGLPVAACLAAALGLAALWGVSGNGGSGSGPLASFQPMAADGAEFDARLLVNCLSGPSASVSNGCSAADFDADGDVDLRDLGEYQRQFAELR